MPQMRGEGDIWIRYISDLRGETGTGKRNSEILTDKVFLAATSFSGSNCRAEAFRGENVRRGICALELVTVGARQQERGGGSVHRAARGSGQG